VAGLVVPEKSIAVTRIDASGATAYTVAALRGVAWSQDADLRVYPSDAGGAVVVWRGLRDGKLVRQMVTVAKDGALAGVPVDVGAATCATEDGVAWTERASAGKTRVVLRAWSGGAPRDVATVPADREPVLVCGAHRVFALGQGEDDVTLAAGPDGGASRRLVGAKDFGADEEREHDEYTVGDDLGVLRVASGGALALRETKGDLLGVWRKLVATVPADDDVVAVDGDARGAIVVSTRESADACGEGGATSAGTSIQALRIDRSTFAESAVEIAPTECGKDLGPFWTGSVGKSLVVAWVERVSRRDATSAPIAGLSYRTLDGTTLMPVVRVPRPADALVDAGCDKDRCYAVALARAPGTTEMVPEAAQVIAYP
jgi:hypothetical protein